MTLWPSLLETAGLDGTTMILPGEMETGSAVKQPCRGIDWWAHRDDEWGLRNLFLALSPYPHRIGRLGCLEDPRPKSGIFTSGERPHSIAR